MRNRVAAFRLQFQQDPTGITDAALDSLTYWLVDPIKGEDRRLALHLLLQGHRQAGG